MANDNVDKFKIHLDNVLGIVQHFGGSTDSMDFEVADDIIRDIKKLCRMASKCDSDTVNNIVSRWR